MWKNSYLYLVILLNFLFLLYVSKVTVNFYKLYRKGEINGKTMALVAIMWFIYIIILATSIGMDVIRQLLSILSN